MARLPRSPLAERVDNIARYAELAAAQLAVLGESPAGMEGGAPGDADLEAFSRLASARDDLAAEIDAGPTLAELVQAHRQQAAAAGLTGSADDTTASGDTVDDLLARAREALARGMETERAIEQRLLDLREETRAALEALRGREAALRRYVETDGVPTATVDISL